MTFKTDDRVYETSITTGTGTYTLDGAAVGFTTFSGMGANNLCPYFATDDTNWEVGIGTVLTGPDRLERTTVLRSSNADAAVNWAAGTRKIRCGWPAAMALPRSLSKSVAGAADVTLTTDEQRRKIIILTGALTGDIDVIVDATPWDWIVYNNTSGAYTLTFKTTAGSGIAITQGTRTHLECDGTNVVNATTGLGAFTASGLITAAAGVAIPTGQTLSGAGAINITGLLSVGAANTFHTDSSGNILVNTAAQISFGKISVSFSSATHYGIWVDNSNDGSGAFFHEFGLAGTSIGSISRNGAGSAVLFNTTSDYRIKDLHGPFSGASDLLRKLVVHDGNFKGNKQHEPMMVAHEVQIITPWAVSGKKDEIDDRGMPKYQQLAIGGHEALLIAGWQDHEARFAALEARQ